MDRKRRAESPSGPGWHRRFTYGEIKRFAHEEGLTLFVTERSPVRIQVVEDDPQFADFLFVVLSHCSVDFEVAWTRSGFEAGRLIQKYHPMIMLLDLMLPTVDGFEVCRQLRADPETMRIRVIAMTGCYSQESVLRILQAGTEACLKKTFPRFQLLSLLDLESLADRERASITAPAISDE